MPLTTLTIDELYNEIADLARDQGIKSKTGWSELAEATVEAHMEMGEIDLDEDADGMKEDLKSRWTEFKLTASGEEEEGGETEKKTGTVEDKEDEYDEEDEEDDMEDDGDDDLDLDYGDGDEEV